MPSASPPNPDITSPDTATNSRPWVVAFLWLLPVLVVVLILAYGVLTRTSDEKAGNLPQVGTAGGFCVDRSPGQYGAIIGPAGQRGVYQRVGHLVPTVHR